MHRHEVKGGAVVTQWSIREVSVCPTDQWGQQQSKHSTEIHKK